VYLVLRLVVLALGLAVTNCQLIAGIETHDPDPLPDQCTLPAPVKGANNGSARLAHLLPTVDKIDVCARVSGSPSYGRPIFRGSGTGVRTICGDGLKYSQVTAPFKVPTGSVDFKVIPAGKTCSAPPLGKETTVQMGPDAPVTLAYMGPPEGPGSLTAMYESVTAKVAQNRHTRFVNAIGGTPLTWGVGAAGELPTTLQTPFLTGPLSFGQLATPNMAANPGFDIDTNGYLSFSAFSLPYGAAVQGSNKMLFVKTLPQAAGYYTLYAIGAADSAFPLRGLYCRDQESDSDPALQSCDLTDVEAFKIDVMNAGLYGAFAVVEPLRAAKVIEDVAARGATSDLFCVSEIARHDELELPAEQRAWTQEALIRAAKDAGFPYVAQAKTNLDSVIDEPLNQQGEEPAPPGRAPCDSSANQENVNRVYNCLMNNCNTEPGMDTGVTGGGSKCYSENCGSTALGYLLFGSEYDHQCFNCIILNGISYMPWGKIKERCATDTRRPYGWNGTATSILLSKSKLLDVDQYVIPTSAFRRVAIYARMEYEAEKSIDVYCVHAPPLLGGLVPYTGGYSNGAPPTTGAAWQEENIHGIQKVIGWIQRKSAGRPAIIMGDWSASASALDKDGNLINNPFDGIPQVADVTPEGLRALQSAFHEAIPAEHKEQCTRASNTCFPQCTRCPGKDTMMPGRLRNPYNSFEDPFWNLRVYIKDPWVPTPTQSTEIFYNELDRVRFREPTEFGLAGPLADTFGFRVNIRRP
jgi:hypothetical protein